MSPIAFIQGRDQIVSGLENARYGMRPGEEPAASSRVKEPCPMKIYIGNLGREVTIAELRQVFEAYGTVSSVTISYDETGRSRTSRGFAFVEMPYDSEAQAALDALCGYEIDGRLIIVR